MVHSAPRALLLTTCSLLLIAPAVRGATMPEPAGTAGAVVVRTLADEAAAMPAPASPEQSGWDDAGGAADLDALLAEADVRSPRPAAARARARAATRVPPRVSALPDPWLTLGLTNERRDAWTLGEREDSNLRAEYAQEVPWPGKRPLMRRAAEREAEAEEERARGVLLDVRARVKSVYHEIYRIDASRAILEENGALLRGFEETTRSLHETGRAMLENVLRAQSELTRLQTALARLDAERQSMVALLNGLVGRDPVEPLPPVTHPSRSRLGDAGALAARVGAASPEVKAMEAMVAAAREELALARRERLPDLMLMGGYVHRAPLDEMVEVAVGFRIPAFLKRKQANAILEAADRELAARQDVEAARLEALSMLVEEVARFERAERLLVLYDHGLLPQSRAALESASAAYSSATADFNTLIDDFMAWQEHRLDRVAEEVAREQAAARIEAVIGGLP
jgi:outer membrane protein TolC